MNGMPPHGRSYIAGSVILGMFVTGIDRDETAGAAEGSFVTNRKIFTYTGAVMTLPTGVQAVAENNYGRPDEAYSLLKRMLKFQEFEVSPQIFTFNLKQINA